MLRSIVRQVVALFRRHVLLILAALVLLAVFVVLGRFSGWPLAALDMRQPYLQAILAVVLGFGLLVLMLWKVPKWQASGMPDIKDRLTIENAARQTLAQIVGGAVLIAGLFFTWANLKITQETATTNQQIAREGQITDRFTKAIEQLGNDKLQIRLGGIYALARIAEESEKDYWPIIEVLSAYVREHAPWPPKSPKDTPPPQDPPSPKGDPAVTLRQPPPKLATDIQAVLRVLGQPNPTHKKVPPYLYYQMSSFGKDRAEQPLILQGDLQRLDLRGTDLRGADLRGAHLQVANLEGAHLQRAKLRVVNLQRANLRGAHLEEADLWSVQLDETHLKGAHLEGANLMISPHNHLDVTHLCTVRTLYRTELNPPIRERIQKQCPKLLEKPPEELPR